LYATTEFIGSGSDFAKGQIVARESPDGGRSWGPQRVLQENVGVQNVMSTTLRYLAEPPRAGTPIGLFYLVKNNYDDLDVYLRKSTDQAQTFGEPILISDMPGYHVMNNDRVTLLASGRLLAPVASTADVHQENHFVSFCFISDDAGTTWHPGKGRVDLPQRGAMEPEVIELEDGRIAMILRTQLGYIAVSYSNDGGDTWSDPVSWNVRSPESPATLRHIPATGDLLLIWNDAYTRGAGHGGKRTPLTAAVSSDEGRTWQHVRNIETSTDETYAYTSLTFHQDRALLSYYVADEQTGRISSRFRSTPVRWFYERD
jgi:sialidase-1